MIVVVLLLSYLFGSIPFGLLLTRAAGLGDIRGIGSGNIGATNVLRTGNKKLAIATFALDALKGAVAVGLALLCAPHLAAVAACGAVVGHIFPIWLKFKGGKGVATGIGVMAALCWPAGLCIGGVWLGIFYRFKISSLAALVAFTLAPLALMMFGRTDLVPLGFIIAALLCYTHRDNIKRLISRSEPKVTM